MLEALKKEIDFNQYTLSIRLCTDGFSFLLYNPTNTEKSVIYKEIKVDKQVSMLVNLHHFWDTTAIHKFTYKAVNIIYVSKQYALIPLNYNDNSEGIEAQFNYLHQQEDNQHLAENKLPSAKVTIVHNIPNDLVENISNFFANAKYYSHMSPIIEHLSSNSKIGNRKKMYVNYRLNSFDIFCFNRGHLLFSNSIDFKTLEDQIYYLLYIWKQQELNQLEDELHLLGNIPEKSALQKKLSDYIEKIFLTHPQTGVINSNETINNLPFDLQTILQCEL
jgi:hypothetical protein